MRTLEKHLFEVLMLKTFKPTAQLQTKTLCTAYLTSWLIAGIGIFDYKLRTNETENP